MAELSVEDIYSEFEDEIESDFIKIKEVTGGIGFYSPYVVGTLQRIARKIYMKYGQRIVDYSNASDAEYVIYQKLRHCSSDLHYKYFGIHNR